MSHPHDSVRVLPVSVAEDGSVTVFGLRYWSQEAVQLASRLVEIRIAHAPYLNGLLVSPSGERLCEVSLVDDPGVVSKRRIFETLARLKPIDDGAPSSPEGGGMIPGIVNAGGQVVALGRRYWSPELYSKSGWEVELHFDQGDEIYPSVWTKGHGCRLCTAALIADSGLAYLDAATVAAAKAIARRNVRAQMEAERLQAQKNARECYWRTAWADAETGPLPFAHFLISSWRRLTHKAHPSYLALKALSAIQEAIVQRLPDPDDYHALSGFQKARLDVLRWLIGDRDIEDASLGLADLRLVPSSTSQRTVSEEEPANQRLHSTGSQSPMTTRPVRRSAPLAGPLPGQSERPPADAQSQAISTDSHSVPTQPPPGSFVDRAETIAKSTTTHRLSETSK